MIEQQIYKGSFIINLEFVKNKNINLENIIHILINIIQEEHGIILEILNLGKKEFARVYKNFYNGIYIQIQFKVSHLRINQIQKKIILENKIYRFIIEKL